MRSPDTLQLDVILTRDTHVESRHRVHGAVVDSTGTLRATAGDPSLVTFWRSCAKPFQLAPLVRAGGLERFGWGDDEVALACASHGGEPEHVAVAARMLELLRIEEGTLACGTHEPMSRRGAELVRNTGGSLTRLHNNCSGKHAAMLARAVLGGWPTAGYEQPDHPVQREILAEVAEWSGVAPDAIRIAVDGCAIPVFGLSLHAMATAYARFGADAAADRDPAARIVRGMRARPFLVGGTDRFDTVLAEETGGAVLAKVGAEGVHCALVPSAGIGVAIKVEDGALRAQHSALLAALVQLGVLTTPLPPRLADFARRPVRNNLGTEVGVLRAVADASM